MSLKSIQIDIAVAKFLIGLKDVLSVDAPEINVLLALSGAGLIDCSEVCNLLGTFDKMTDRVNRSMQSQIWKLVRSNKRTDRTINLSGVDDRRPTKTLPIGLSMPDLFLQLVWQYCSHHL